MEPPSSPHPQPRANPPRPRMKFQPEPSTAQTIRAYGPGWIGVDAEKITTANPNANVRFTGFIAQDVEKAAKSIGYDFSGVDKAQNENDFYGLRYSEFVVPMVKAIQEQQSQIELLKKQNADLMRRLTDLENKK